MLPAKLTFGTNCQGRSASLQEWWGQILGDRTLHNRLTDWTDLTHKSTAQPHKFQFKTVKSQLRCWHNFPSLESQRGPSHSPGTWAGRAARVFKKHQNWLGWKESLALTQEISQVNHEASVGAFRDVGTGNTVERTMTGTEHSRLFQKRRALWNSNSQLWDTGQVTQNSLSLSMSTLPWHREMETLQA